MEKDEDRKYFSKKENEEIAALAQAIGGVVDGHTLDIIAESLCLHLAFIACQGDHAPSKKDIEDFLASVRRSTVHNIKGIKEYYRIMDQINEGNFH